jgi:hypothetical protein
MGPVDWPNSADLTPDTKYDVRRDQETRQVDRRIGHPKRGIFLIGPDDQ